MRMFAGPNGSGKSVLKSCLPTSLLGVYLNPDEIEADVKMKGYLDFEKFEMETSRAGRASIPECAFCDRSLPRC